MKKFLFFAIIFITLSLYAQTDTIVTDTIPKHEIGFSAGAYPLIQLLSPQEREGTLLGALVYSPEYFSYEKYKDGTYEKSWHLGSFALNYNYNLNSKRNIGASLSWMGMHIDKYDWMGEDTINGSGWKYYFALMGNYRSTYYRKNKISLYWGIHFGAALCLRDKDILYKETHYDWFVTKSNEKYFFDAGIHLNAIGIDIGENIY